MVIIIRFRVIDFSNTITLMSTAHATRTSDRVLFHVIDGVADKGAYGLTVLAVSLLDCLIYLTEATLAIIIRLMARLFHGLFTITLLFSILCCRCAVFMPMIAALVLTRRPNLLMLVAD